MLPRSSPLIALVLLVACGRSDAPTDVVRTDSAGVKIISSGARDTVLPWTLEEIDVFRDSLGEPYLFAGLRRQRLLVDRAGRTYVLTRDPSVVRFGRDGREEMVLGRKGGGPGEFELPTAIGSQGDTIWVRDPVKGALVRFLPDLTPAPDRRLEGALGDATSFHFRTGGVWVKRRDAVDGSVRIAVYGDTSGSPPLQEVRVASRPVQFSCMGQPSATPLFTNELPLDVNRARLLVAGAEAGYVLWLYEGTRAIGSVRRPLAPRAPTVDDVRAMHPDGLRFTLGFADGTRGCTVPVEELVAKQGLAPTYPFAFDVALHADGEMWVLRTPPEVADARVDVFGPDGLYRGTLRGRGVPLARLPNGELLFVREDSASGGQVIARVRVVN